MPELPEVETIVTDLRAHLHGRQIIGVQVWDPLLVRFPDQHQFAQRLTGRIIRSVARRGKYIVINLDQHLTWLIHLRMTGRLLSTVTADERYKRAHFALDQGELWYCDLRRFGDMWAYWPGEEGHLGGYNNLGPEPLSDDFDGPALCTALSRRRAAIKALLLNQSIVAGLGNIYVDEALFVAGIFPGLPGCELTKQQCAKLVAAVKEVLARAIIARGTTFRDYRSGRGTAGQFQNSLHVYGRGGLQCVNCATTLERLRLGGRTTVYCPHCQK